MASRAWSRNWKVFSQPAPWSCLPPSLSPSPVTSPQKKYMFIFYCPYVHGSTVRFLVASSKGRWVFLCLHPCQKSSNESSGAMAGASSPTLTLPLYCSAVGLRCVGPVLLWWALPILPRPDPCWWPMHWWARDKGQLSKSNGQVMGQLSCA